jgi:hypothetical protein
MPSFNLIDFDYFDGAGNSIFYGVSGSSGSTGFVQLFDPDGRMLQSLPSVLDRNNIYSFNIPTPPGASGFNPFTGYYIRYFDSDLNILRPNITYITSGATGGIVDLNADGGTASDYFGSSGNTAVPANLIFPYEFQANAAEVVQITLLGELAFGPSGGVLQTITMKVPKDELTRMFIYDTAWSNGMTGVGGGIGISGLSGLSGTTSQTSMFNGKGATGPNVGLLLQYVLSNLNVESGFTGQTGLNQSNRLVGLDYLFSTQTPTWPQNGLGVTGNGNPWGILSSGGPTGGASGILGYPSSVTGGYFLDDAGITCAQMGLIVTQQEGSTGPYVFGPNSLLNKIPIEAVRSMKLIDRYVQPFNGSDGIFKDIDTTMSTFRAPLQNLFEQAVAFQRVTDTTTQTVSSSSGLGTTTGPWLNNSTIYGVDFYTNDTLSLFVKYQFGQIRQYGIDPTAVAGLGPKFTRAPVYQITFAGKTFNIPIGKRDTYTSIYPNEYNIDQFLSDETSLPSITQTVEIRLVATEPLVRSVFDN